MATQDISRHVFQPAKHYAGARAQQGRVILDSDINEGELLDDEAQRAVAVDVVSGHGSADDGFVITNVTTTGAYDFDILAGSYHLGGIRHEIADVHAPPAPPAPQRFRAQTDWRQSSRDDVEESLPDHPGAVQNDLVYLVGWEQSVSATEDGELLERALDGLDTSVRMRSMHRVLGRRGILADGEAAFNAMLAEVAPAPHTFDSIHNEVKSAARLSVMFVGSPQLDDFCGAPVSGYRGPENQAIRVQLIATNRLLWAYENASPLYRVAVDLEENEVTVTFRTPPQEQAFFPLAGQVIELLPWGAALANGEQVADHPIAANIGGGVLARVTTTYNPRTRTLVATVSDPTLLAAMIAWYAEQDPADPYFYARVWNPGGGAVDDPPGIGFMPMTYVALPGTNIHLSFSAAGIVGDYWILAARPSTPTKLVPWDLLSNAAPHGPRRFYCPLAVLKWTPAPTLKVTVDSYRRTFKPLTRIAGCCTVTVGDGATSFGDYTSIADAIKALPTDHHGKVCLLPGTYEERVVVAQRANIVIEGCGARTILRTPDGNTTSDGLFTLKGCSAITLRDFVIEATGQSGVMLLADGAAKATYSRRITLERLAITTRRDATLPPPTVDTLAFVPTSAPFPMPTIHASGALDLQILDTTCRMVGDLGPSANVFLMYCERVLVRGCKILTPPAEGAVSRAWGGLHVAGECTDVRIEHNEIRQGLGYGITLGSVSGGTPPPPGAPVDTGNGVITDDCPVTTSGFGEYVLVANVLVPLVPLDGPHEVTISDNRITGMSSSGISVLGFFSELQKTVTQIRTRGLVIANNTIEDNYVHPSEPLPNSPFQSVSAIGGIVLADADSLRIRDNIIQDNGATHVYPVCGIYVLHGEDIVVENNLIRDNGKRVAGAGIAGHRAGIALQFVGRALVDANGDLGAETDMLPPAARVRGNIVHQPAGRALQMYGLGPMFIEGNVLASEGLDGLTAAQTEFAAHCIEIQNLGQSPELQLVPPAFIAMFPLPQLVTDDPQTSLALVDGRVLFTNNQVRFNPVTGRATDLFCATRIQSYGDVAVLGNQFFTKFPPAEGTMLQDTVVTGWSLRVNHNRWEDPAYIVDRIESYVTKISAMTVGYMNVTCLNQASRCIHAHATAPTDDDTEGYVADNPMVMENQIYRPLECEADPTFDEIFGIP